MLKQIIASVLWPPNWIRAHRYSKSQTQLSRTAEDPQLQLYDQLLKTGFLHYAYFDDPQTPPQEISLADIRSGQVRYAQLILEQMSLFNGTVLDVGCGMGGLIRMLLEHEMTVYGLTPDRVQIDYLRRKYPMASMIHTTFQEMPVSAYRGLFDHVIHSESLQYIELQQAIRNVLSILKSDGRWIVSDYFRITSHGHKSGHPWNLFLDLVEKNNLKIIHNQDITPNIAPMLAYIHIWGNDIGVPVFNFGKAKLKRKHPGKYYLIRDIVTGWEQKIEKNLAIADPIRFAREKKYVLMTIVRK